VAQDVIFLSVAYLFFGAMVISPVAALTILSVGQARSFSRPYLMRAFGVFGIVGCIVQTVYLMVGPV
jgi:hypothetical protein